MLCHNQLRHTGEEVKAKNENHLTRARTREKKMEEKFKWQPLALPPSGVSKSQLVSSAFSPRQAHSNHNIIPIFAEET